MHSPSLRNHRTGYARGTLAVREGLSAPVPQPDPRPLLTMAGMGHGGMGHDMSAIGTAAVGGTKPAHEPHWTNRLVLQPLVELEIYGKSDPERGIGAGLNSGGAGLRLRYEFRREFAPYVGVTWTRKYFGTADLAGG